jgi:hypothetical protein
MIFSCPHCDGAIWIEKHEYNCRIIRHGTYKSTGKQIDPHMGKETCDMLVLSNQIYGCGKPSRIVSINNEYLLESCEYI